MIPNQPMSRLNFIKLSSAATATAFLIPNALASGNPQNFYNLQLGAYRIPENAEARKRQVAEVLSPSLSEYVHILDHSGYKLVVLDLNTPYEIAEEIKDKWLDRTNDIDKKDIMVVKSSLFSYDGLRNHSLLLINRNLENNVEADIDAAILQYLTAYSNTDVVPTRETIIRENEINDGTDNFVQVRSSWFKNQYRDNLIPGVDYVSVFLDQKKPDRNSLADIASNYASCNLDIALAQLIKFNEIKSGQETELLNGANIAIPISIYKDPTLEHVVNGEEGVVTMARGNDEVEVKYLKDSLVVLNPDNNKASARVTWEGFFLSNPLEQDEFLDEENLHELADKLANGIDTYNSRHDVKTVVLSVGHGESDPGATIPYTGDRHPEFNGKKLQENTFNKKIALRVKETLAFLGNRYDVVVLNYDAPRSKTLQADRLAYYYTEASKFNPDTTVFIDIHNNSSMKNTKARGTQVYVSGPNDAKSIELAVDLKTNLDTYIRKFIA